MNSFIILDCIDSGDMADARRRKLHITRDLAIYRTRVIKDAVEQGMYEDAARNQIGWRSDIVEACLAKRSISPCMNCLR